MLDLKVFIEPNERSTCQEYSSQFISRGGGKGGGKEKYEKERLQIKEEKGREKRMIRG